jgi:hypothetical protein
MSDTSPPILPNPIMRQAARRAAADTFFLGHVLSHLTGAGRTSPEALAARLRCTPAQLQRLWMCRRPAETGVAFRQEVERIAVFVGCDAIALAQAIREADAVGALKVLPAPSSRSVLLAARDRPASDTPEASTGGPT